jgi:anti-sigma-K factor RskA
LKHDILTEEAQETAALYALGALCQHDSRAFEQHLVEGCSVCEAETRSFEKIAVALAAAELASPPANVRELLTSRIQREPRAADAERASTGAKVVPLARPPAAIPAAARPSAAPRRENRWSVALPWAVAAALLVTFAITYTTLESERRSIIATSHEQIDAALRDRDRLSAREAELREINTVLSSRGMRMIALAGQDPAPMATGRIYWDIQSNRWVVSADLPAPPAGKVYQLWFVTKEAKISAGLIKPDAEGHGFVVMPLTAGMGELAAAAITLEPEGGSAQPTMPIYALGTPG